MEKIDFIDIRDKYIGEEQCSYNDIAAFDKFRLTFFDWQEKMI